MLVSNASSSSKVYELGPDIGAVNDIASRKWLWLNEMIGYRKLFTVIAPMPKSACLMNNNFLRL